MVEEGAVLGAKALGVLLLFLVSVAPSQGLALGKGWPGVKPRSPSLTRHLFPDDYAGGGGVS